VILHIGFVNDSHTKYYKEKLINELNTKINNILNETYL